MRVSITNQHSVILAAKKNIDRSIKDKLEYVVYTIVDCQHLEYEELPNEGGEQ